MFTRLLNKFSSSITVQLHENRLKIVSAEGTILYEDIPIVALKKNDNGEDEIIAIGQSVNTLATSDIAIYRPYANSRIIIDDFEKASIILRYAVEKAYGRKGFFSPKIMIQVLRKFDNPLTEIEKQVLQELAQNIGAREVVLKI